MDVFSLSPKNRQTRAPSSNSSVRVSRCPLCCTMRPAAPTSAHKPKIEPRIEANAGTDTEAIMPMTPATRQCPEAPVLSSFTWPISGVRRHEVVTVTVHRRRIHLKPARTSEIARPTTIRRRIIGERALIQVIDGQQSLFFPTFACFSKRFALRERSTAFKSSACESANSAQAASKIASIGEPPPCDASFGRSSSSLLLLRSVILIL